MLLMLICNGFIIVILKLFNKHFRFSTDRHKVHPFSERKVVLTRESLSKCRYITPLSLQTVSWRELLLSPFLK